MYCNYCGKMIPDDANLCAYCGRQVFGAAPKKRLTRPRAGRKIGGVCAGLAEHLDMDVTLVRLLWLFAVIFTVPLAILGYIVAWIVIPEECQVAVAVQPTATPARNT
jgi:phage shock protein C